MDFAYPTVKDRIPVILTRVIDQVYRLKSDSRILENHGQDGIEDLKLICGALSKLRNEIQTDKPLLPLEDKLEDTGEWNKYLEEVKVAEVTPSWFCSAWLYTECYFYRRITQAFQETTCLKDFDPFAAQKEHAFMSSLQAMQGLGQYLLDALPQIQDNLNIPEYFTQFLQVCLWGNKCDLSISGGADNFQTTNPMSQLLSLKPFLLSDATDRVLQKLRDAKDASGSLRIDIVLDNAGFELFTDLCFAEFLTSAGLAKVVYFHGKSLPWFVSDVTRQDFDWTLSQLTSSESSSLNTLGQRWKEYLLNQTWNFVLHEYWTLPHDFSKMKSLHPDLYAELSKSHMIFFKGDLNYRKLTGDLKWDHTERFEAALRGFTPAPLCTLRTLKSDLVVGLEEGQADSTQAKEEQWLINGNWAVIQMCDQSN